MATYKTSILMPGLVAEVFAFVADFRNAPRWDPRTYQAEKLTDGPVGLGTWFLLRGGIMSRTTQHGLRVPEVLRMANELPYEVIAFEPNRLIALRGETDTLWYEDHIELAEEGAATRLRYTANLELKGMLKMGDLALDMLFQKIGEESTRGMPAALTSFAQERAAAAKAKPMRRMTQPGEVRSIVAMDEQPVLRNLLITQGYHDLSEAMRRITGGADMNWCTLGKWASKTAGAFIRNEEAPAAFLKLLEAASRLRRAVEALPLLRAADAHQRQLAVGWLDMGSIREAIERCSSYITAGNKVVFAELAGCFADFLAELGDDASPDPGKLAAFQARLQGGMAEPDKVRREEGGKLSSERRGGQTLLRGMVGCYYRAMFEADPKKRAELLLFGNAQGGVHEQTRLQPYIVGGLDAPIDELIIDDTRRRVALLVPAEQQQLAHNAVDAELVPAVAALKSAWHDFATNALMTLPLPDGVLHLGDPMPAHPRAPLVPPALEQLADRALRDFLAEHKALDVRAAETTIQWLKGRTAELCGDMSLPSPKGLADASRLADAGAVDWTDLAQRMKFILTLFRMRQQERRLFAEPFTDEQRDRMLEGHIPAGKL